MGPGATRGPPAIGGGAGADMAEPQRRCVRRYRFIEGPAALALRIPEVSPRDGEGLAEKAGPARRKVGQSPPCQRSSRCVSGAGLAVRHVRVALRRGPGPVPLGAPRKSAWQASAGGTANSLLARRRYLCLQGQLVPSPISIITLCFQIGAGVSLPGVLAAKCGAEVTLSDSEELPQCLQNCRRSCLLNHLPHVPVIGLTWGQLSPQLLALAPVDIILGSDVFFDPKGMQILSSVFDL